MPAAVTVQAKPRTAKLLTRSPWLWWHFLSLDATTVAVVWCWFFASISGLGFHSSTLLTLGLGTWCVYVADRLLDGWRSADGSLLRDRHWFYIRNRKPFVIAWVAAASLLVYLILTQVQHTVRTDDIALCWIGVAYFAFIHGSRRRPRAYRTRILSRWFSKELIVGFLFAVATSLPAWAALTKGTAGAANFYMTAAAVLAFGSVCWLNCVAIQVWEDADIARRASKSLVASAPGGSPRRPFRLTASLGGHLDGFAITVSATSFCLTCATANTLWWPTFAAVTLSAALFLGLICNSHRISTIALRVAADAALLTPLLFLLRGL